MGRGIPSNGSIVFVQSFCDGKALMIGLKLRIISAGIMSNMGLDFARQRVDKNHPIQPISSTSYTNYENYGKIVN